MLIKGTLNRDDVNGDFEIACQQLRKFQAMENSKDMFHTAVGGKGSTGTGQEKRSTVADFRGKTNHDEIPKKQGEVKELRNLTTDSFGDFYLGQNSSHQSNRGLITGPSGVFRERPREVPNDGPRGTFAEAQSNLQGLKDNDMGMSQGWGVGLRHAPKPKTKHRGRGYRGRGRGFHDVNQLGGDNPSQFSQRQCHSEGGASQPRNSVNRGRGQRGLRRTQSFTSLRRAYHPEAIGQSPFQQNQLLASGLSALTTKDCLAISGGEVQDVMTSNDKAPTTTGNAITGKLC